MDGLGWYGVGKDAAHQSSHSVCVLPSLSDIPDDEAQYWTGKLDRINTMRIYDEVRPTLHAKALFHQEHVCQKCSNKFYLFIFQAVTEVKYFRKYPLYVYKL